MTGMLPVSYFAAPGNGSHVIAARLKLVTWRCPYRVVGSTVVLQVPPDVEESESTFSHQPLVGARRREVDAERLDVNRHGADRLNDIRENVRATGECASALTALQSCM